MMFIWFDKDKKIYSITEGKDNLNPDYIYIPHIDNIKSKKTVNINSHKLSPNGEKLYINEVNKETTQRFNNKNANQQALESSSIIRNISFSESPTEWSLQEILEEKYKTISNDLKLNKFWFDEFFDSNVVDIEKSDVSTSTKGVSVSPNGCLITKKISLISNIKKIHIYIESKFIQNLEILYKTDEDGEFKKIDNNDFFFNDRYIWIKFKNTSSEFNSPISAFALLF